MRKGLVLLIFVLVFFVGACGEDDGNCSGLFSSYEAGLCWSSLSLDSLSWFSASSYCEDIGGRLPSIVELRSLVIN